MCLFFHLYFTHWSGTQKSIFPPYPVIFMLEKKNHLWILLGFLKPRDRSRKECYCLYSSLTLRLPLSGTTIKRRCFSCQRLISWDCVSFISLRTHLPKGGCGRHIDMKNCLDLAVYIFLLLNSRSLSES